MTSETGTHQLDEQLILDAVTYQIDGSYTNLDHQETDDRSNVIFTEQETIIEIESVTYGEDFEITLTDQKVLDQLEAELYNLD